MTSSSCRFCKTEILRSGKKPAIFCSIVCKSEWQKTQKPVTKDWLVQKYLIELLSTYKIAAIVHRNPKQVWHWLKGYNIPIRTVEEELDKNAYRKKVSKGEAPPTMLGKHHSDFTKQLLSIQRKGIIPTHICGKNSSLYGKFGALNPQWKGGVTPEREKISKSPEWKLARKMVIERDGFKCIECNVPISAIKIKGKKTSNLCLHHIASFAEQRSLRCDPKNLVLLCRKCHHWTHSGKNLQRKYLL